MPTFFRDSDIPALMLDFGVPVVIGSAHLNGIVDYVGKDVLQSMNIAGISGTTITVTCQTSALPSPLRNQSTLTVDGQSMILRDSVQEGDGAITHLLCERA
jgi:hypothetical protein